MNKKFLRRPVTLLIISVFLCLTVIFAASVANLSLSGLSGNDTGAFAIKGANAQETDDATDASAEPGVNEDHLFSERSIGSDNAPVIIHEYSSLSCGHCATFHNETLEAFKEKFVDTGQVKLVFHEFPLNRSALVASLLARCLPEEQYYNFIQLLFETQSTWAYSEDYETRLKQNAKLAGLNEDQINACLNNEDFRKKMVQKIRTAQEKHSISSTPTFIFENSDIRIDGSKPLSEFEDKINKAL